MQNDQYHTTVLLHEGVDALNIKPDGVYVDATLGAGGHSREILSRLGDNGRLFGFDQDADAVANAPEDGRFEFCFGNFRFMDRFLRAKRIENVDGIIADLGVSGHHFDQAERGFSFRFDADLDMRMNQEQELSAVNVINEYEAEDLLKLLRLYGESSFAKPIVKALLKRRAVSAITKTGELVEVINAVVPDRKVKGELPKVFQAIRIEVNSELDVLKDLLVQSEKLLKSKGRVVVLSYHSLEDRMVKHFFRSGNFNDQQTKDLYGNIIRSIDPLGKAIVPSAEEIERNPRARSAKMRIGVKR